MKLYYIPFLCRGQGGGGGSWGSKKYCEHIISKQSKDDDYIAFLFRNKSILILILILIHVYIRKIYWFIQCNAVYIIMWYKIIRSKSTT